MHGAHLALVVLLGQVPQPDPTALVAQLGASRYADREAAAGVLERLGRQSVSALRAARSSKDPEVRSRSSALLQKIEGALLTQPTLVTLDFNDRPLTEVVKAVGEQAGIKIALLPENLPVRLSARVTLRESAPVPFWKAIDRLCDEGHLYYNPTLQAMPTAREPVFPLYYGGARPAGPVSDQGPFRVTLLSLHYQHDVSFLQGGARGAAFVPDVMPPVRPGQPLAKRAVPRALPDAGNGPNHAVTNQCYAQLQIAAEPRLSVSQAGALKIVEAVDDQGQSLVMPQAGGGMMHWRSGYSGLTTGAIAHLQAPLNYTPKPGATIKRLRGAVPIAVTTRKPNPLTVTLTGAAGKTFQSEDVSLSVHEIKTNPNTHQTSIELSIRPTEPRAIPLAVAGTRGPSSPTSGPTPTSNNSKWWTRLAGRSTRILPASTPKARG